MDLNKKNPVFAGIRNETALLVGLVAVAAASRLYGLDIQSLWNDELSSWLRSSHDTLKEVVELGLVQDRHPPGYRFLLWAIITSLGDTPTILRAPSAIAGIACVPAIWWLGRVAFGNNEGLLAATLMTVTWAPLYFSQEATGYSILMLTVIITSAVWLSMLRTDQAQPIRWLVAYVLAAAATCYVHYYGGLIVATQLLLTALYGLKDRRKLRLAVAAGALVFLCFLPWLPYFLHQLGIERKGGFPPVDLAFLRQMLEFVGHQSLWLAIAFVGIAVGGAGTDLLAGDDRRRKSLNLVFLTGVPIAVLLAATLLYQPILAPRHLTIILPSALLLLARGLTLMIGQRRVLIVAPVLGAALLFQLVFFQDYYQKITKEQFRETAAAIHRVTLEHPNALIIAYAWSGEYLNYYLRQMGSEVRVKRANFGREAHFKKLQKLIKKSQPEVLIYATAHRRARNAFVAALSDYGSLREEMVFAGATFRSYDIHQP